METIKVTNPDLYNERVIDVDIDYLIYNSTIKGFEGMVVIEVVGERNWREYQGQHGAHDYEDEFGFVLVHEV